MGSNLDSKADFTRDLTARLGGEDPGALAERTGLAEATVRALLAGDGTLMSWEVVSACLAAAGMGGEGVREVRDHWAAAEQALWEEHGAALRTAFEQNTNGKPAQIAEEFLPKVPFRRLTSRFPVGFEPWALPRLDADRRLPDPDTATDIRDFYRLLGELKAWAGSPRQSEIERRSWGTLPDATVSAMLQKDRWRSANDRERFRVGRFARACGLPETEVTRWVEAYQRLRHVLPPDDLALARAEGAELRRLLDTAHTEVGQLRRRLTELENQRPPEPAPAADSRPAGTRPESERQPQPEPEPVAGPPRRARRWRDSRVRSAGSAAVLAAVTFAAGAVVGGLTGTAVFGGVRADRSFCFTGTLRLIGSTAFRQAAMALRQGYADRCPDAEVVVDTAGSNEGVRMLTADQAGSTIVMHDGHLSPGSDEVRLWGFRAFPVALVTFAVVVHKDAKITDLSLRDLRSIYAREEGPTTWSRFKGGADLPIRMVSRTEGSGTRAIFEGRVLSGAEPELSSGDCLRKDEIRAALRVIRCERSSQAQVLDMVNRVPGAIGYVELRSAADAPRYPNLRVITLDGRRPTTPAGGDGYPFVAPEVFYTYGFPPNDTPVAAFLTFLTGDEGRKLIRRSGLPDCVTPGAASASLCQSG